jgi:hypothetical protein
VNVTRGISEGPPWCINLNITAYRVNHLVSSADQQDSAACYDLLFVLTENTPTSSSSPITTVPTCAPTEEEKVCSRSAMIVEGSDVISISRTTFLPRTEAPYNWMDDSNEVDRVREFGEYIDAHQKPGDETRNPSNQYIIKIPSSQRIVTQSASCHLSDDLVECYYNALPVLEAAKFLESFGENDNNGGGNGLYNLGGGTGGIGSVGISSRFDSTYTVKNYNESVNAMNEFVVDESKVSQLQDMGFDAEMARNALKSNRNDIDAAANHIISLMYA